MLIDNVKRRFHTLPMPSELWQRIRAIRKHLGETQEVFGARFGVSKGSVAQWESANPETRTAPELPKQVAIAKAADAPLLWLINDAVDLETAWWDFPQQDPPPPRPSVDLALDMLAKLLAPLDADARQSAATLLASWALDPAGKKSNAMLLNHLLGPHASDATVAAHIKPAPKVPRSENDGRRDKPKKS